VGKVVMYSSVSVDGFVADETDQSGPLFDWLSSGMDVVPVVFGSGKRYFGSVHAQHLLEDPDVVIQGNRVLHLRYRVRR
jgi:hypothetical protein